MRHAKRTFKLNRTGAHRRCLIANMLKALIHEGRIETTVDKAKHLKRYADRIVTLAKHDSLANRRRAMGQLMLNYNPLTPKEARRAQGGDRSRYNADRQILGRLFHELGPRFKERGGGYTRLIRLGTNRSGDQAAKCLLEFLPE